MTAPAPTELRLLIEEYDPQNSDWNFRKSVMLNILDRQAASVERAEAIIARCMEILEDVPGEHLVDRVNRIVDWHKQLSEEFHSRNAVERATAFEPIDSAGLRGAKEQAISEHTSMLHFERAEVAGEAVAGTDPGDIALAAACCGKLCSDCPPLGYPTDATRCNPCPRRAALASQPRAEGVRASEVQTTELVGAELGRWCYENPNLAAMTIEGLRSPAQASVDPAVWVKGLLDLYFAPWGAAKAARFEEMTGDKPFDPEVVLKLIHDKLKGSDLPSADGGTAT
jgi:hypothetical protein